MKRSFLIILSIILLTVFTTCALAEKPLTALFDSAEELLFATSNVTITGKAEFTLDDIAATVDLAQVRPSLAAKAVEPKPKPKEAEKVASSEEKDEGVAGSIWLDALTSVLKRVPVYNAVLKEIDHRLLPITGGKIMGANADKVYYMVAPDNDLRGFRVQKGDYLLVVPAQAPVDGAIMLVKTHVGLVLRKIKVLPRFQAMLQKYDNELESDIKNFADLTIVGRCVRLEADL